MQMAKLKYVSIIANSLAFIRIDAIWLRIQF